MRMQFSHLALRVAKVLVDLETGKVTVEEITAVHDAGRVINPDSARGQLEGGCLMGVGYALMEELVVDQGKTLNPSLSAYLIPTSKDVPNIKTKIIEIAEPYGPYGAKGIGKSPLTPTAPAILNAVVDASGAPLFEIPISEERVLEAIDSIRNSK